MMRKTTKGFTLIELMIVIAIMGILAISVANVDWNRLSDKQRATIYKNRVISNFETVRNDALLGRGIGVDLETPDKWKIDFNANAGEGDSAVKISYDIGGTWTAYDRYDIIFKKSQSFINMTCSDLYDTVSEDISSTGSIIIEGADLTLTGCTIPYDPQYSKLNMNVQYKGFDEDLTINTINGLIE